MDLDAAQCEFIKFISITSERLSSSLERLNNLPNILQNIGIALLTILIPLAIAILNDVYQKRREQKIEFSNLDLHVILDRIFKIKQLLLCVALIFLPTIFWEISSGKFRSIVLVLPVVGIYLLGKTVRDIYYWIKGNAFEFRFSYLKNLKNHDDMEAVWRSVWQTKNINTRNEEEFFRIFSYTIDRLLGQ